ncbi:hypothetical protein Hdeb2414_s0006g00209381 [Helianthus debilis subsp. tardiflorus]
MIVCMWEFRNVNMRECEMSFMYEGMVCEHQVQEVLNSNTEQEISNGLSLYC